MNSNENLSESDSGEELSEIDVRDDEVFYSSESISFFFVEPKIIRGIYTVSKIPHSPI